MSELYGVYYESGEIYKTWNVYDENDNSIYFINYNDFIIEKEYDENGNNIYYKDSEGVEQFSIYDENNCQIEFKEIENGIVTQHCTYEYVELPSPQFKRLPEKNLLV